MSRYIGLSRYADAAQLEKTEKVKFGRSKVECYVVQLPIKRAKHKLFIASDSYLVLRHIEEDEQANREIRFDNEFKSISLETPPPDVFEFQPPSGSKQTEDILLPSERNMSLVGKMAVDFTLKNLDGVPVHLADLRGKIVLLDFWASWCPPCRAELPTIEAISKKYSDRNVAVFGVNDEAARTATTFLEKTHPNLQSLHDEGGKIYRTYGAYSIPTVLVINPEGKIVAHFVGERSEGDLVSALKQAGLN